jgi:hypothetical protein
LFRDDMHEFSGFDVNREHVGLAWAYLSLNRFVEFQPACFANLRGLDALW